MYTSAKWMSGGGGNSQNEPQSPNTQLDDFHRCTIKSEVQPFPMTYELQEGNIVVPLCALTYVMSPRS